MELEQSFQTSPLQCDDKWCFEDIGILLKENFHSQEQRLQHASEEYDLVGIECVEELEALSAKNLIVKEVIEDLIVRTLCLSYGDEETDEEEVVVIPRVRRGSSLKTGKTPSPNSKKIVRFADVLGMDLADVRMFLEDVPSQPGNLLALFQQPIGQPNFLARLTMSMVLLEDAHIDDAHFLQGTVRVRNLAFHKRVHVRHSLDSWKHSTDVEGSYIEGSSDGFTDRFRFKLPACDLEVGSRLEFAVRYRVDGLEFWDNNNGHNYCFTFIPPEEPEVVPLTPGVNEQFATFYYDATHAEGTSPTVNDHAVFGTPLSSTEVQAIISRSLGKHQLADVASSPLKPEVLLLFVVLFLSVVLLYAKRLLF